MGTSHVRPVPLMLTMQFYQPRAGHVTDVAVLAKTCEQKGCYTSKGAFFANAAYQTHCAGWEG